MVGSRFVGSPFVRIGTVGLGLSTVGLAVAAYTDTGPGFLVYAAIIGGVLTWIGLVHSHSALFRVWMQFAELLHNGAILVLFSLCYLIIVPVFGLLVWYRDPLRLRRKPLESSWVSRNVHVDASSLERMG